VGGRGAREVVEELTRRMPTGGGVVLDDLVAADMVNHAAGPQGRDGLASIFATIDHDLGPITVEQHHLLVDGEAVTQHLTLHSTHRASTMPLLADVP
jgi:lactoylglutathione lyase